MRDEAPLPPPSEADRAQQRAADPARSVWLGANAGSGKTRVLTDRVARLLFGGTPPDRILCLTFTKAAAGEMQNRLFDTLGGWAMASDDALRAALRRLGADTTVLDTPDLARARTLFAQAIETPGGLKIQTIHAFCAGLLRRFPLEAGIGPAFREMDDTAARLVRREALDAMAEEGLLGDLAAAVSDTAVEGFVAGLAKRIDALGTGADAAALTAAVGAGAAPPVATPDDLRLCADCLPELRRCTTKNSARQADLIAALPGAGAPVDLLAECFLTQKGERRKALMAKAPATALGEDAMEAVADLADRLVLALGARRAAADLHRQTVLHAFAPAFLSRVAESKARRGWVDFDDQIRLAKRLLCDRRDVAQWVLHKLDGGVEHILVDESQDTSPDQWAIIKAIAAEFGAGEGAHEARGGDARTVFVVGDLKQSIYAFQGAEPERLDDERAALSRLLEASPAPLEDDHRLLHSFRSSPLILDLVDRLAEGAPKGGMGADVAHRAFHALKPGRVDLWDVMEDDARADDPEWWEPLDAPAPGKAGPRLAAAVADRIASMIAGRVPIETRDGRRPVAPGDVLILMRSRKPLYHQIVAALKARGLPLAGADQIDLAAEIGVQDLLSLLRWTATPEDDLSLAEVLRSPLGGLDEDALFRLAHGRAGRLWPALRAAGPPEVVAMLSDCLRRADFLRPYEMLQRVLIRHDGMRRLIARLGEEAREGIEVLLAQALAFEALEVPGLTAFLEWLAASDVKVKRQTGSGAIRVMTVHGAKGLEAPVVVLPDCSADWNAQTEPLAEAEDGTVVWMASEAEMGPALRAVQEARKDRRDRERERLLYVAATRAESWLIVAAAKSSGKDGEGRSWWDIVSSAMADAPDLPPGEGPAGGRRLETGDWTTPAPGPAAPPPAAAAPFDWMETDAPAVTPARRPLAPSDLGGAKSLAGEHLDVIDQDRAKRHGTRVHLLLEHLPGVAPEAREAAARRVLSVLGPVDEDDLEDALDAAGPVLDDPALAWVFAEGTLAEAPFVLPAEGGRPEVSGTMDRVILGGPGDAGDVWVVDHKTNAVVPGAPEAVPEGLLRQLGAYAAALGAIYPERRVRTAILWTEAPSLMEVPLPLAQAAWARAVP